MIEKTAFPFRVILYLFENPITRTVVLLMLILFLVALLWPGALYFYPFWNTTITKDESTPFTCCEKEVLVEVQHPNKLLPGKHNPYNILIEIENTTKFDSVENIEIQLWEEDRNIVIDGSQVYPLSFKRSIPANTITTILIPVKFSMDDIDSPYRNVEFSIRIISTDGNFTSGFKIPIDFYSVPVIALAAIILPIIYLLLRLIAGAWR